MACRASIRRPSRVHKPRMRRAAAATRFSTSVSTCRCESMSARSRTCRPAYLNHGARSQDRSDRGPSRTFLFPDADHHGDHRWCASPHARAARAADTPQNRGRKCRSRRRTGVFARARTRAVLSHGRGSIFKLTAAYKADEFEQKINLGVGAYRDDHDHPWVLPVVRKVRSRVPAARGRRLIVRTGDGAPARRPGARPRVPADHGPPRVHFGRGEAHLRRGLARDHGQPRRERADDLGHGREPPRGALPRALLPLARPEGGLP
jgi:hypothetical protein